LGSREANRVRRALRGLCIYGDPAWNDAVRGDAAAAIGIAIRVAVRQPAIEPIVDLAMAPVLAAAIDGDAAARLFISHMLAKRADVDKSAKLLAASWLEANRVAALAARTARSTKAKPCMRPPRSRRVMSCAQR
jgi:hypothetical protein